MKLVIPGIDAKEDKHHVLENMLRDALLEIKNKTNYQGYIESDDGKLMTGTI